MKGADFIRPLNFIIQWHLTERCNWYCKHCYQSKEISEELPFRTLKKIFKQCLELFGALQIRPGFARINIGGGEPFLRKDLFEFLSLLAKYRNSVQTSIMTNGSFITNKIAKEIRKLGVSRVQVSLEGLRELNDAIRGRETFDKTIKAIELLRENGVVTRVSLTLNRMNLDEVDALTVYLKKIGVNRLGIRRFVPLGRGEQLKEFMLTPLEQRDFYLKRIDMKRRLNEKDKFFISDGCEDGISAPLPKQLLYKADYIKNHSSCAVVKGYHLNIFSNGDILACRRFPLVVGNVLKDPLLNIYFSSNKLWAFRNLDNAHPLCKKCFMFKYCLGGAKCITYAYFGNPFAPDPQCWLLFKGLPHFDVFGKDKKKYLKKEFKTCLDN